jgi:hypothetical protein
MTRRPTLALSAALALAACAAPAYPPAAPPPAPAAVRAPAAAAITPAAIRAHVDFLASDAMRGRDTPSPELNRAAEYLVERYRALGLRPAGEEGTFYQWWPVPAGRLARGERMPGRDSGAPLAPNVLAMIPGSDPALRDEYVVLSAHLDHVGVGRPVGGDSIYNGADDNASGTAALLAVAEAMARLPEAPRRTVVFLHVSGEEKGLLGSRWYSENPTLPVARTVANVNVDMIAGNAPDTVVVIGKTYSSLGPLADRVGASHPELGLAVSDDPWPEERFFFRSDHFNFARLEVPAIFFFTGVHDCYHRPCDEPQTLNYDKAARVAGMIFHVVHEVANDPARPVWDPAGLEEVRRLVAGGR